MLSAIYMPLSWRDISTYLYMWHLYTYICTCIYVSVKYNFATHIIFNCATNNTFPCCVFVVAIIIIIVFCIYSYIYIIYFFFWFVCCVLILLLIIVDFSCTSMLTFSYVSACKDRADLFAIRKYLYVVISSNSSGALLSRADHSHQCIKHTCIHTFIIIVLCVCVCTIYIWIICNIIVVFAF